VFAPRPDANFVDAPNAVLAGTNLLVRSSNADIGFTPRAYLLAADIAIARDALASLRRN